MSIEITNGSIKIHGKALRVGSVSGYEGDKVAILYKLGAARKWRIGAYAENLRDARTWFNRRLIRTGTGAFGGIDLWSAETIDLSDADVTEIPITSL